jgi:hypothetical protein
MVSDGVALATVMPVSYSTPAQRMDLMESILARLERAPGVRAAVVVDNIPIANNGPLDVEQVRAGGRSQRVYTTAVSRGLFDTLQIRLVEGRDFTVSDGAAGRSVGIVNRMFARLMWPGEPVVGKQLETSDGKLIDIVGVASDSRYSAQPEPIPLLFRPIAQRPPSSATYMVRTTGNVAAVFPSVRALVAEIDPDLAPYNLMTFNDRLGLALIFNRAAATLSGVLGVLVLVLGSIGIFGMMALLVEQRRREFGVRAAVGAARWQILAMVLKQGMMWTVPGLALGIAVGALATFGLSRVLRGIEIVDPVALAVTPLVLATTACLACLIPARRASRVDPARMLSAE